MIPRVLLLATGDTLAHRRNSIATGAELLAGLGEVPVDVRVEDVQAEPSWDTSPATMLALARRARKALAADGFDGVVVTHGVDTVEETAFLTDLFLGPARGGVVFTGATRRLDDPDSNGLANLADALVAAAHPVTRVLGAVVCFDHLLHAARWATLTDVTFSSAPHAPLGRVAGNDVIVTTPPPDRLGPVHDPPETDVALIKTYPGMPTVVLTSVVDAGARGVVLEGTGAGNVPVELFTTIMELTGWDIPVVIASRARPERHDTAALALRVGAIGSRGLAGPHARVALMTALGAGGGVAAARTWFDRL
ncbi:asparaginase [Actinokineospora enzanensis]|uniref:asparaginase n=1 Tax=Actinokineospora enzanensis TaxID=155975 RepID=UPI000366BF3C|nr:asparaginase domain-containing protein [Actinokineospora enzanensis]